MIWEVNVLADKRELYFDINDESNWSTAIKWHLDMASKLYDAFSDRIKKFN